MADPLDIPKYRNAAHALYTVVKEEGAATLWRGVSLTALRQGTNQAANFTTYSELRAQLQKYHGTNDLPSYETSLIGLMSGAVGPFTNAPIDTIKTRLQKQPAEPGVSAIQRITAIGAYVTHTLYTYQAFTDRWTGTCGNKRAFAVFTRVSHLVSCVLLPVRL
jgi:solute carrier family 25 citrate transporter 1